MSEEVSKTEDRMPTLETVDTLDGVLVTVTEETSCDSDGVRTDVLVGSEVVGWSDGEEGVMAIEDNKGVERTGARGEGEGDRPRIRDGAGEEVARDKAGEGAGGAGGAGSNSEGTGVTKEDEDEEDEEGVTDEEGVETDSVMVLNLLMSCEDIADAVGHKTDVSKDISGPSGGATDWTEGEARSIDDSKETSVSGGHSDSRMEGLGDTSGDGMTKLIG